MPTSKSRFIVDIEEAKRTDKFARQYARPNYGPLEEEPELDSYEAMMLHAPSPLDFEPCESPCRDANCPCHYRDA